MTFLVKAYQSLGCAETPGDQLGSPASEEWSRSRAVPVLRRVAAKGGGGRQRKWWRGSLDIRMCGKRQVHFPEGFVTRGLCQTHPLCSHRLY